MAHPTATVILRMVIIDITMFPQGVWDAIVHISYNLTCYDLCRTCNSNKNENCGECRSHPENWIIRGDLQSCNCQPKTYLDSKTKTCESN